MLFHVDLDIERLHRPCAEQRLSVIGGEDRVYAAASAHELEANDADIKADFAAVGQAVRTALFRLNADGFEVFAGYDAVDGSSVDQEFAFPAPPQAEPGCSQPLS